MDSFVQNKKKIDEEIEYFVESMNKKKIAINVKENLTKLFKIYKENSCEFVNFLERVDTEESKKVETFSLTYCFCSRITIRKHHTFIY